MPPTPPPTDTDAAAKRPWLPPVTPTDSSIEAVLSGHAAACNPDSSNSNRSSTPPVPGSTPSQHSLPDAYFVEETPDKNEVNIIQVNVLIKDTTRK
jgi:hypothetical protein